jgi:hypothetical protein
MAVWDGAGSAAATLELLNRNGVDNWRASSPRHFWVEDRAGGIDKMYATRFNTVGTIATDEVWTSSARYRTGWIDVSILAS